MAPKCDIGVQKKKKFPLTSFIFALQKASKIAPPSKIAPVYGKKNCLGPFFLTLARGVAEQTDRLVSQIVV